MPLTKLWGSLLAFLATAFLAGMFLLSLGNAGGFSDADRAAIQAVTEAGLAAVRAEIESSPVQRAPSLLTEARLRAAIDRPPPKPGATPRDGDLPLAAVLADVSEEILLGDNPQMTVGILDDAGNLLAANGIAEPLIQEALATTAFKATSTDNEALFSATLGGQLHVVKVSRTDAHGHRLVAIQPLPTGAGSLLRRVLGTKNPAGLVRDGKLLGDIIGDLQVGVQIEELAASHAEDAPDEGGSEVFRVGEGLNARIGAIGRVPGPAGRGGDGTMLVVLSRNTAAAGQQDLAEALTRAKNQGLLGRLNWALLGAIAVLGMGLAMYLPHFEALGPMRRLTKELTAVAQGQQHQVFVDRYGGVTGQVARAAHSAHEAVHAAYLVEGSDAAPESASDAAPGAKRRTQRSRRLSRAHRSIEAETSADTGAPEGIELPADDGSGELERHSHRDEDVTSPILAPAPAAPTLTDDLLEEVDAGALAASIRESHGSTPPRPPPPIPAASVPARGSPTAHDVKETYFREIYEEFVQVKIACGEPIEGFTYDKFAAKLRKNTEQLMDKPGITDVQFTVYVKDGKAALKAKVVKD